MRCHQLLPHTNPIDLYHSVATLTHHNDTGYKQFRCPSPFAAVSLVFGIHWSLRILPITPTLTLHYVAAVTSIRGVTPRTWDNPQPC
jgi:hypothetical protein